MGGNGGNGIKIHYLLEYLKVVGRGWFLLCHVGGDSRLGGIIEHITIPNPNQSRERGEGGGRGLVWIKADMQA